MEISSPENDSRPLRRCPLSVIIFSGVFPMLRDDLWNDGFLLRRCRLFVPMVLLLLPIAWGDVARADLAGRLTPLIKAHPGQVAVSVRLLSGEDQFGWREAEVHPTASLIKVAVMVTAYRMADAGQLDLNSPVTLSDEDKVPGSGILTDHFSAGTTLSLRDAIRLMIRYSDNTATNLVVGRIGLKATSDTMEQLGFPHTKLHSLVYRRDTSIFPERSRDYGLGSTTAQETTRLLEMLWAGKAASQASCEQMLAHLVRCDDRSKIGRNLPATVRYANKTGAVSAVRCDAGLMDTPAGTVAVCVLTSNNADTSWGSDNQAEQLCALIGREILAHFTSQVVADPNEAPEVLGPLCRGDSGELVKDLQRTLNSRGELSLSLAVDGDFGPATEAAVKKLQAASSLEPTGVVDAQVWQAMGPLVAEPPVPEPETVNAEFLPVEPVDPLDGPPLVTARSWVIADAVDGTVLWGHDVNRPLDMASTTKMMTAWLVLKLAESDPGILDETLTFSSRAAGTRGSTSALRAGETLAVREALYGLMLPSGNDMSVALAEHFGHRLRTLPEADIAQGSETDGASNDPVEQFVEAMNREAEALGMKQTSFRNPHGLTSQDHRASALDLVRLARTAWANQHFREYVGTRRRAVTVVGVSGYRRNVVWENTNQLLGIEGFDGIKTGTTERAGACLVSTGQRNGRRLVVVVLGSAASAARYADTRNLYRWAWSQLESAPPAQGE
jgi:serine-type D-Ala-D-Ala carboxypeptidase (penicillin-binding protein 5/6)